jgi:chitodextrinase
VDAVDAAGNRSAHAGIDTATAACADTTPPSAPGIVQASARGTSTLAVAWGAASDDVGVAGYGVYLNGSSVGTTSASQRSWNLSGLACDTMYSVGVDAVDAAGNRSAASSSLLATTPCPDTTPPSTPSGLAAASVTQTGATLSWTAATDNAGVTGYRVYRDGTALGTTASTSYAVTGLTCGTTSQLGVEAYDGAGNTSGRATLGVTAAVCAGPTPSVFLSPTGSDANACSQAAPCKTLQRGFNVASAGAIVQLAGGTYAGGTLAGDKGSTADVVFQPAPGAAIAVSSRLTLAGLHHVTLRGLSFQTSDPVRDLMLEACNDDLTLDSLTGRKFMIIEGNSNVTMLGSSWGGYGTPGDTVDNVIGTAGATGPVRQCGGATAGPATNILIDRTRFHHVFWGVSTSSWSGAHPDCFEINGYVNGVTIRNSEFDHCVDSFFGLYTDQGDLLNVTFENNSLHDGGTESWYAIQNVCSGSNGYRGGNIVFRGNTFDTNPSALDAYPALRAECAPKPGYASVLVQGNTFAQGPPSSACTTSRGSPYNTTWDANRFTYGSACGTIG